MFLRKIKKIIKSIFFYFFEKNLIKNTIEENFYDDDIDKNYLNNLFSERQLINQRSSYFLLFLNNIILEILMRLGIKENLPYIFLSGLFGINILSFLILLLFLIFSEKEIFKKRVFNCFITFQYDFVFLFSFISKAFFLEFEQPETLFKFYKILLLNFFLTLIIKILFYSKELYNFLEIALLIIYKILLFSSFIIIGKFDIYNGNRLNGFEISNFFLTPEIYNLSFYIILFFYFLERKKIFIKELKRILFAKSDKCSYYQSLLNMLNKSFLSFNMSSYRVNCNSSFIIFLRKLGLSDKETNLALDVRDI